MSSVFDRLPEPLLRLANEVCNQFEIAWRQGRCPSIREFLESAPPELDRETLLSLLIPLDVDYRRLGDENPAESTYSEAFPDDVSLIQRIFATIDSEPLPSGEEPTQTAERLRTLTSGGTTARQFGDYELLDEIGVGGMGVVYKARQTSLDRLVALKMLHGAHHDRERFRMEAESAAGLTHPNIVSILESGEQQGRLFFSMQYIDGCNLKDYIDQHPVDADAAAEMMETIARAVHYAHQRGILHRDLKPANVIMDSNGQPHIADFGLAQRIERETELTVSGTILGTPGYMAPEQASGKVKNLTTAVDVYGLGAILYTVLTGDAPFTGDSSLEILRRVIDEPPTSPRVLRRDLDRDMETICLKCLEKSPELRYASADHLATDLSRYLAGQPVSARPVSAPERFWRWCRRNPLTSSLSAAVVILLLATTIVSVILALSQYGKNKLLRDVSDARSKEAKALQAASRTLDDLCVATGMMYAQSGRVGEGVLWLSEAAKLTKDDPAKLRAQLISCQSWLREHPLPIAATILDCGFNEVEQPGPKNEIHFRPNPSNSQRARQLLCKSGAEYFVWNYDQKGLWHLNGSFQQIACATWSPNGVWLVTGDDDGWVQFVDPDFRTVSHQIRLHDGIAHVNLSSNSALLAIASGNTVRIWNVAKKVFVGDELIHSGPVLRVLFNGAGDRLVALAAGSGLAKSVAHVYSVAGAKIGRLFDAPCQHLDNRDLWRPLWPMFVRQGTALMLREDTQYVKFLDSTSGEVLGTYNMPGAAYSRSLTADGTFTVTGSDNHVRVCKVEQSEADGAISLREAIRLEHPNRVFAASIHPDGIIASGGGDGSVRLWRAENALHGSGGAAQQTSLLAVLPHQSKLSQAVFSADGSLLATAQTDGLIRIWEIPEFQTKGYRVAPRHNKGGSFAKLVGRNHWMVSGMNQWTGNVYHATVHFNSADDDQAMTSARAPKPNGRYYHVLDAACSADMQQIATVHATFRRDGAAIQRVGKDAGSLRVWSFSDGSPLHEDALPMPSRTALRGIPP